MVDNGDNIDVFYVDLAKIFDTVSHNTLLHKLSKLGIGGCLFTWYRNFLQNRLRCVTVESRLSSFVPVQSSIPQEQSSALVCLSCTLMIYVAV